MATDPNAVLFKMSMLMSEQGLAVRNRAVGTTIDIGNGRSGVVAAVDGTHMHARAADGSRHQVPLGSKRLAQLADMHTAAKSATRPPTAPGSVTAAATSGGVSKARAPPAGTRRAPPPSR